MQLANTLANIGCNNIIPTKIYIKIKLKASPIILTAKTKESSLPFSYLAPLVKTKILPRK